MGAASSSHVLSHDQLCKCKVSKHRVKMACPRNVMVVGLLGGKTLNLTVDNPVCIGKVKEYFREREVSHSRTVYE